MRIITETLFEKLKISKQYTFDYVAPGVYSLDSKSGRYSFVIEYNDEEATVRLSVSIVWILINMLRCIYKRLVW